MQVPLTQFENKIENKINQETEQMATELVSRVSKNFQNNDDGININNINATMTIRRTHRNSFSLFSSDNNSSTTDIVSIRKILPLTDLPSIEENFDDDHEDNQNSENRDQLSTDHDQHFNYGPKFADIEPKEVDVAIDDNENTTKSHTSIRQTFRATLQRSSNKSNGDRSYKIDIQETTNTKTAPATDKNSNQDKTDKTDEANKINALESAVTKEKQENVKGARLYVYAILTIFGLSTLNKGFMSAFASSYCVNELNLDDFGLNGINVGAKMVSFFYLVGMPGKFIAAFMFKYFSFWSTALFTQFVTLIAIVSMLIVQLIWDQGNNSNSNIFTGDSLAACLYVIYGILGFVQTLGFAATFGLIRPIHPITAFVPTADTIFRAVANTVSGYGIGLVLDTFGYGLMTYIASGVCVIQCLLLIAVVRYHNKYGEKPNSDANSKK